MISRARICLGENANNFNHFSVNILFIIQFFVNVIYYAFFLDVPNSTKLLSTVLFHENNIIILMIVMIIK